MYATAAVRILDDGTHWCRWLGGESRMAYVLAQHLVRIAPDIVDVVLQHAINTHTPRIATFTGLRAAALLPR